MKRFFAKASKPLASPNKPLPEAVADGTSHTHTSSPALAPLHTPGLPPKYVVPPVPHPYPHDHLAILATKDGLLIRPHIPGQGRIAGPRSYIRISWGKVFQVEEIPSGGEEFDWGESAVIYGIVGVLELYSSGFRLSIDRYHNVLIGSVRLVSPRDYVQI